MQQFKSSVCSNSHRIFCSVTPNRTMAIPNYSNDILQPMQDSDLLLYRDLCAKRLPAALVAHHFLIIQHRWKQISIQPQIISYPRCIYHFYVPRNRNIDNCTFIAISGESSALSECYRIFPFTLEPSSTELINCLEGTARIDWQKCPQMQPLPIDLLPNVEKLLAQRKLSIKCFLPHYIVSMSNKDALTIDVE